MNRLYTHAQGRVAGYVIGSVVAMALFAALMAAGERSYAEDSKAKAEQPSDQSEPGSAEDKESKAAGEKPFDPDELRKQFDGVLPDGATVTAAVLAKKFPALSRLLSQTLGKLTSISRAGDTVTVNYAAAWAQRFQFPQVGKDKVDLWFDKQVTFDLDPSGLSVSNIEGISSKFEFRVSRRFVHHVTSSLQSLKVVVPGDGTTHYEYGVKIVQQDDSGAAPSLETHVVKAIRFANGEVERTIMDSQGKIIYREHYPLPDRHEWRWDDTDGPWQGNRRSWGHK